jgi:hypothetical protein
LEVEVIQVVLLFWIYLHIDLEIITIVMVFGELTGELILQMAHITIYGEIKLMYLLDLMKIQDNDLVLFDIMCQVKKNGNE